MLLPEDRELELTAERKAQIANRILGICFVISCVYFIRYLFFDSKDISIVLLTPFLVLPLILVALNYFKKYALSGTVGLLSFNVCLFLVASSESLSTGMSFHFISASAVAIAIYDYQDRWKSIAFICLSVSLLLITHLSSYQLVEFREYTEENQKLFFTLHTLGMAVISGYSIYMLLGHNFSLQKYLIANQKLVENQNLTLKKTNEELDRFVYSASHDLRAPLSSIKGLVTLIEKEGDDSKTEYTPLVKDRIEVMESFIHDIVHYSRNSRIAVKQEEVSIRSLITEVVETLAHFDNAPHITITNDIPTELKIKSDPYRLKVIITNLVSNAIKYADLKKDKPFVSFSYKNENNFISITFSDNGVGIDAEHLDKIFDMFYRATVLSQGSGLGLYIAMESARKMNYLLTVKSVERQGTVFALKIPKED